MKKQLLLILSVTSIWGLILAASVFSDSLYSDNNSAKESIKISLRFLANEIRSESLKVIVHQKICTTNFDCRVILLSDTKIKEELHSTILRKAALLEKESKEKKKR